MYKRLRQKFLWGSVLVLLLVILAVMLLIFLVSSSVVDQQTQVLINLILENDGKLPEGSSFDANQQTFLALNEESIYETRYFSVLFSDDSAEIVTLHIAMFPRETALSLAEDVRGGDKTSGRIVLSSRHILRFARRDNEDGSVLVVCVDMTSRSGLTNLILIYMGALWIFVLVLFILLMTHFSRKIVRPFVENDEKQKRFITNASHELKTPLAVISANNEMAEALGGKTKWTESTGRQVRRMQSLIEDLVVLTRLNEMEEVALTDVDFSLIARETAEPFRAVAESAGKRLETEIAPDLHVQGEKRALQQLTSILLDNAVKYCDEDGAIGFAWRRRERTKEPCCRYPIPMQKGSRWIFPVSSSASTGRMSLTIPANPVWHRPVHGSGRSRSA